MTLVFLDTETTGLDHDRHEVWEIAYALDDGPILSAIVRHSFTSPDPTALALNRYLERALGVPHDAMFERDLRAELDGGTIVGANPAFDAAFLRARWGFTPWHHRLWDVEAYAAGVLGLDGPHGLARTAEKVRALGFDIPEPDHTAAGDVATLRATFNALRQIATKEPA